LHTVPQSDTNILFECIHTLIARSSPFWKYLWGTMSHVIGDVIREF
jgi:hypothetical protein